MGGSPRNVPISEIEFADGTDFQDVSKAFLMCLVNLIQPQEMCQALS